MTNLGWRGKRRDIFLFDMTKTWCPFALACSAEDHCCHRKLAWWACTLDGGSELFGTILEQDIKSLPVWSMTNINMHSTNSKFKVNSVDMICKR